MIKKISILIVFYYGLYGSAGVIPVTILGSLENRCSDPALTNPQQQLGIAFMHLALDKKYDQLRRAFNCLTDAGLTDAERRAMASFLSHRKNNTILHVLIRDYDSAPELFEMIAQFVNTFNTKNIHGNSVKELARHRDAAEKNTTFSDIIKRREDEIDKLNASVYLDK